jgi:oleate hydratase
MGSYQRISTSVAIENKSKKAYLVGGGIASLAAAFYLIQDGHLEGKNITILERCPIAGGSMDGCGNEKDGYIIRGGREMEEHYECTWDLFGQIPSIYEDNKTVLEEFKQLNDRDPNFSTCRVIKSGGEKVDVSSFGLSEGHIKQLLKLLLDTE